MKITVKQQFFCFKYKLRIPLVHLGKQDSLIGKLVSRLTDLLNYLDLYDLT